MFSTVRQDIARKACLLYGDSKPGAMVRVVFQRGTWAVLVYRFGRWAGAVQPKLLGLIFKAVYFLAFYFVQMLTGISVQSYARIGPGFVIMNYSGIFVVAEEIGRNFTVYEGVTVGNIRGKPRLAILGDNITLEPGAKVLGDINVGSNVIVRANSLVITNVPDNSLVIGNPARVTALEKENQSNVERHVYG